MALASEKSTITGCMDEYAECSRASLEATVQLVKADISDITRVCNEFLAFQEAKQEEMAINEQLLAQAKTVVGI